jgi:hypothetical protein
MEMSLNSTRGKRVQGDVLGAGAAGGGVGTVIATLANSMPNDSPYKSLLIVTAPILSVGISGLWLFVKTVYINPYAARKEHDANRALFKELISEARATYASVLADPNATPQHKEAVRKDVEKLERIMMQDIVAKGEVVVR